MQPTTNCSNKSTLVSQSLIFSICIVNLGFRKDYMSYINYIVHCLVNGRHAINGSGSSYYYSTSMRSTNTVQVNNSLSCSRSRLGTW